MAQGSLESECPSCRRQVTLAVPLQECSCGEVLRLPLLPGRGERLWKATDFDDLWVRMRCPECRAAYEMPRPEHQCECGAYFRPMLRGEGGRPAAGAGTGSASGSGAAGRGQGGAAPGLAAADPSVGQAAAAETAGRFLRDLGFADTVPTPGRRDQGVDVAGVALVGQVKTAGRAVGAEAVRGLVASASRERKLPVYFTTVGFGEDAVAEAARSEVALFVIDPVMDWPSPANAVAVDLVRRMLGGFA